MSAAQALESLKVEFDQWRQQKKTRGSRVPNELRQKALALQGQVKTSHLVNALGIGGSTLKEWSGKKKTPAKPSSANGQTTFVTLPADKLLTSGDLPPSPHTAPMPRVHLSCESRDGLRWCLHGDVNPEQLSTFITTLTQAQGVVAQ